MSKKLKELKEWATENVTLVKLLPPNDNLQVTTRLIDVLEDEVDEKYYLSEEKTKKLTLDYDLGANIEPIINVLGNTSATGYKAHDIHDANGLSPTIAARDYKGPKQIAIKQIGNIVDNKETYGGNPQRGRVYNSDGLSPALNCMRGGGLEPKIAVREATKQGYAIAEQGDSVNVTYPDSKTRRGRVGKQVAQTLQAGEVNQGVVIPKEEYGRFGKQAIETLNDNKDVINDGMTVNAYNKTLDKTGISPTLTTRPEGFKTAVLPITNGLRIRKLTPLECWRLQGFTDEQFYKAKDSGVSNSQLYKQAGNSVTVNVVDAIVKQLN